MAAWDAGTMSIAGSETIGGRIGAGGGCRKSRLLLGYSRGVVVLGLALAATVAVAAEGGAALSGSHEVVH